MSDNDLFVTVADDETSRTEFFAMRMIPMLNFCDCDGFLVDMLAMEAFPSIAKVSLQKIVEGESTVLDGFLALALNNGYPVAVLEAAKLSNSDMCEDCLAKTISGADKLESVTAVDEAIDMFMRWCSSSGRNPVSGICSAYCSAGGCTVVKEAVRKKCEPILSLCESAKILDIPESGLLGIAMRTDNMGKALFEFALIEHDIRASKISPRDAKRYLIEIAMRHFRGIPAELLESAISELGSSHTALRIVENAFFSACMGPYVKRREILSVRCIPRDYVRHVLCAVASRGYPDSIAWMHHANIIDASDVKYDEFRPLRKALGHCHLFVCLKLMEIANFEEPMLKEARLKCTPKSLRPPIISKPRQPTSKYIRIWGRPYAKLTEYCEHNGFDPGEISEVLDWIAQVLAFTDRAGADEMIIAHNIKT